MARILLAASQPASTPASHLFWSRSPPCDFCVCLLRYYSMASSPENNRQQKRNSMGMKWLFNVWKQFTYNKNNWYGNLRISRPIWIWILILSSNNLQPETSRWRLHTFGKHISPFTKGGGPRPPPSQVAPPSHARMSQHVRSRWFTNVVFRLFSSQTNQLFVKPTIY